MIYGLGQMGFCSIFLLSVFPGLESIPNFILGRSNHCGASRFPGRRMRFPEAHLALYERICNISRADFTDDFEIFNWFVPIDRKGHQYGDHSFKMTEAMARASKARIAAKRYPETQNSALPSCISMERRSICGGRICMGPSSTAIGPNTSRTQNSARL